MTTDLETAGPGTGRDHAGAASGGLRLVETVTGPATPAEVRDAVTEVLAAHSPVTAWHTADAPDGLSRAMGIRIAGHRVHLALEPAAPARHRTLDPVVPEPGLWRTSVLSDAPAGAALPAPVRQIVAAVRERADRLTREEVAAVWSSMPLLRHFADRGPEIGDWALVFRDHYVENSVGFLLAAERAGIPAEWIYALAKGDRTAGRHRVHAWFRARGYRSAVLDNSVIDGTAPGQEVAAAQVVAADVDRFIAAAHRAGRRVLVIDDGGLLARAQGPARLVSEPVDAVVELTVSGLKRIGAGALPCVPVFNIARSQLKSLLSYEEIADSCLRRLRELVPGQKFIGRRVVAVGFGTLGSRLARRLRSLGCRVTVVDQDTLALIQAAEQGFETEPTLAAALRRCTPFLVTGSTGEPLLGGEELALLPDGVLLAGFATKDFSLLSTGGAGDGAETLTGVGVRYRLPDGGRATLLGDGRSLNLFDYEGIPNGGYDAYRAGTLIAVRELCRRADTLAPGVHVDEVDEAVRTAGLFEAYYDTYIADTAPGRAGAAPQAAAATAAGAARP
ncbi:NAD(P)-dependent oxidoreductase [Streptomyces sp. NPDC059982]|uniref:NAD(P)-dependent oxidoreductase n=1 Tax=Streptomyces sp. NPDC059982 TaxID=3347024 RepID=UPI003676D999